MSTRADRSGCSALGMKLRKVNPYKENLVDYDSHDVLARSPGRFACQHNPGLRLQLPWSGPIFSSKAHAILLLV
jgi:hypothetical protein